MSERKQIDTLMLPMNKYLLVVFSIIIISFSIASFFIFLDLKYHNHLLGIIGIFLCIAPAFFIRLKIDLIAKNAMILFSEDAIEIKSSDTLNDIFFYSSVKYFSASKIGMDSASKIKFVLENGYKKHYIFFRQLNNDESILNNVLHYFSLYNTGKIQEAKIHALPNFFVTKSGKLIIAIAGLLILAAIVLQAMYKPKAIPYSLFAVFGAYIQVKRIQRNDEKVLKTFREQS